MLNRTTLSLILACGIALPAAAQPKKPEPPKKPAAAPAAPAPKEIGQFGDWIAATHEEAGVTACYTFTRAQSSAPSLPDRGQVLLTVTERPTARDSVAMEIGYTYPANAAVTVQIDQIGLDFFTARSNAFARDGKAAVAALQKGERAIARSPGPKSQPVTDTFSLKGFSAAYAAIVKACPAKS